MPTPQGFTGGFHRCRWDSGSGVYRVLVVIVCLPRGPFLKGPTAGLGPICLYRRAPAFVMLRAFATLGLSQTSQVISCWSMLSNIFRGFLLGVSHGLFTSLS